MKTKLTMMAAIATACATVQLTAMPTAEETRNAEPVVRKMLAQERAALESGRKTRSEVAVEAMKLAAETDTDAAKLLLMKGAFVLYVKDGNLEKAVETMKALEVTIPDMPPQSVTNMIEMALLGVSDKVDHARLYKLLDESTANIVSRNASSMVMEERNSIVSILKGMIKVPGRDYWLSATELTQGQWESVMGYNLSSHRGANLPVENVSRDDCDAFLEKLNQTQEVKASQFEFRLPELGEWKYAAWAGSAGHGSWIKPGIVGDVLDMAWVEANSSNQTHAVATKAPNAFGFYDMLGNVWEWLAKEGGDAPRGCGSLKGCAFNQVADKCTWNQNWHMPKTQRNCWVGLRLAAHIRPQGGLLSSRSSRPQEGMLQQATVDGYTWSYRVNNGEATIVAEKDRKHSCAVSPTPTGDVKIPAILGGVKVTRIGWEAFRNCRMLTSVTIPEGVTHIDVHALGYCGRLKSVTLPSSLKDIGYAAFGKCRELTSVTIPNGVKSIGADAFNGCGLKFVVIPESVTHIGDRAFCGCAELESVAIPAGVASLGNGVFGACNALKTINVDSGSLSFTSIDGALYTKNRTELVMYPNPPASVVMPKGVTKIRGWAFAGGKEMTSVTIPEGVTNIGDVAFRECSGLKSITIPSSVKKIEEHAFLRCGALTDVTMLGERPELQKDNIFDGCGKLKAIHVPANAKSWAGMKEWQGIPLVFDRKGIGRQLQAERAEQQQVTVGGYTWSYRVNKGVATLVAEKDGKYSCAVSPAPTGDVSIPPTLNGVKVTSIGREAFENCPGLKSVTIPEGVKVIDWKAFRNCKELTSVTFPEGLTHIGYSVFVDCHGLKFVTLPSSLKVVGWGAFVRCVGLTSVTIPEGVTSIGNDAFNGCSGLKSVVIPDSVTSIGTRAFIGCRELTSVTIPAKVASIGEGAFGWCSKLKQIKLAAGNQAFTLVDGVLYPKDMSVLLACPGTMTSVTIPAGVTKIGDFAFRGCNGLESMMIPEGVTNIGWGAFEECDGLRSVTIPESVTDIAGSAFKSCRNLTSVTMRCERPDASDDIFQDCGKLKSIHVPANAKSWSGRKEWRGIPLVFDAK